MKVLLVEDDTTTRILLEDVLAGSGHEVVAFGEAESALTAYQNEVFPLLVLDWLLPGMDGLDLCRRIRELPRGKDAVIVVITGRTRQQDLEEVLAAGASDYVPKPIDFGQFKTRLAIAEHRVAENTKRRQAEDALQISEQKRMELFLEQSDRMISVGTLAAGVAHELNNPLCYVLANIDILHGYISSPDQLSSDRAKEQADLIRDCREGLERILNIVRSLKNFSRVDDETVGAVDIRRVIDLAVGIAQNDIGKRASIIKQTVDIMPVKGNEGRLGQLLLNLIINAVQAIPEGKMSENEIRVSAKMEGKEWVVVEVADTGVGIPPEIMGRIFEPFFTTKPVGVGTGLGLPICREIVSSMGGKITVESKVNQGTKVRAYLPVF
jgi:signal transduction histidine kinase